MTIVKSAFRTAHTAQRAKLDKIDISNAGALVLPEGVTINFKNRLEEFVREVRSQLIMVGHKNFGGAQKENKHYMAQKDIL